MSNQLFTFATLVANQYVHWSHFYYFMRIPCHEVELMCFFSQISWKISKTNIFGNLFSDDIFLDFFYQKIV